MLWVDLFAALALVMVIEGALPFLSPALYRKVVESMADLDNRLLRTAGLVSMVTGLALLYFVRAGG